jgi:hypothetical protein
MVHIHIYFWQDSNSLSFIHKQIELSAIPLVGSYFEYEDGWGMCYIVPATEQGMHLHIAKEEISISGFGPNFTEEEIGSLKELGWEVV